MNQPLFVISNNGIELDQHIFSKIKAGGFCVRLSRKPGNNIYQLETQDHYLVISSNSGFYRDLKEKIEIGSLNMNVVEDMLPRMQWGFVLVIQKITYEMVLFNDLYGIFPIYHYFQKGQFICSDSFTEIACQNEQFTTDYNAVFDYFLFNYTLNERTFFREIHRLEGGSKIRISNGSAAVSKTTNLAEIIRDTGYTSVDYNRIKDIFVENISQNLIPGKEINLALSGGFDSKVTLAVLLSLEKDFSAFTFGARDSIDHSAAKSIAEQFHLKHQLIEISDEVLSIADDLISTFVDKNPSLPLILDLISYELVNRKIPPSNLVTGMMGGELIAGPVIISEVIMTRSARELITNKTIDELGLGLHLNFDEIPFLDGDFFEARLGDYLPVLENYRPQEKDDNWKNLTNFLLNETYAKFFGAVFNCLSVSHNLINPFVDIEFLRQILNSRMRYPRIQPFSKNPFAHYFSRRLYPNLIKRIYDPVLFTKMERDFLLADIYYLHRLPRAVNKYIQNHYFRKNKAETLRTLNYMKWFRNILVLKLENADILDLPFICKTHTLELLNTIKKGEPIEDYVMRKLIMLLGFHYFHEKFKQKVSY